MNTYNLNDNVEDSFKFEVGGHAYSMRYPLVEELEELEELYRESEKLRADGQEVNSEKLNESVYGFITPIDPVSPNIQEALKKQNVRVLQNFNKMVLAEIGIS